MLRDLDVRGKRVLVRVDFNVPVETRGGKIRMRPRASCFKLLHQDIGAGRRIDSERRRNHIIDQYIEIARRAEIPIYLFQILTQSAVIRTRAFLTAN